MATEHVANPSEREILAVTQPFKAFYETLAKDPTTGNFMINPRLAKDGTCYEGTKVEGGDTYQADTLNTPGFSPLLNVTLQQAIQMMPEAPTLAHYIAFFQMVAIGKKTYDPIMQPALYAETATPRRDLAHIVSYLSLCDSEWPVEAMTFNRLEEGESISPIHGYTQLALAMNKLQAELRPLAKVESDPQAPEERKSTLEQVLAFVNQNGSITMNGGASVPVHNKTINDFGNAAQVDPVTPGVLPLPAALRTDIPGLISISIGFPAIMGAAIVSLCYLGFVATFYPLVAAAVLVQRVRGRDLEAPFPEFRQLSTHALVGYLAVHGVLLWQLYATGAVDAMGESFVKGPLDPLDMYSPGFAGFGFAQMISYIGALSAAVVIDKLVTPAVNQAWTAVVRFTGSNGRDAQAPLLPRRGAATH